MERTVSETAKLMGISVRTLHYYDTIGLLHPSRVSAAGYRYYDSAALETLQQILFYRELEFSLADIAALLARPDYDKTDALRRRRALLLLQRQHLDTLLALVDETLEGNAMSKNTKKVTATDIEAAKKQYAAETAARWGTTDAYAESEKRHAAYTSETEEAIAADAQEIFAAFAAAMDKSPADPAVQALVKRWQDHITRWHYPCSKEILACLGQMYTADARFTANIDQSGDGTAQFMGDAIAAYCAAAD